MATMDQSQLLKGVLQGCLLMIMHHGPSYGYAITQRLSEFGFGELPKGTIYPLLLTMEKKGLLSNTQVASPDGPRRKYYTLTVAGEAARTQFLQDWDGLTHNVATLRRWERDHDDD